MFHTVELYYQLDKEQFNTLYPRGYPLRNSRTRRIRNDHLYECGIARIDVWQKDYINYCLSCVINLPKLAACGARVSYIDLATEADIPAVKATFAMLMRDFPELPEDIDEWTVKRMDYAINIRVGKTLATLYPALLNRGKPRGGTADRDEHDNSYSYANGSWGYNIYDKEAETVRTDDDPWSIWNRPDLTDVERIRYHMDADGILRIEAQYGKRKLYSYLKQNTQDTKRTLSALAKNDIAMDELRKAVSYISPDIPYRSRRETEIRIRSTEHRESTKEQMCSFVNELSMKRSHSEMAKFHKEHNRLVQLMVKDGINPVALRDTEVKEIQSEELEPLCRVLERQIALVEMWKD